MILRQYEQTKKWKQLNKDKTLEHQRKYNKTLKNRYKENENLRQTMAEASKKYYHKNKDIILNKLKQNDKNKEYRKNYYIQNREKTKNIRAEASKKYYEKKKLMKQQLINNNIVE
jgi:hypothetical protein